MFVNGGIKSGDQEKIVQIKKVHCRGQTDKWTFGALV